MLCVSSHHDAFDNFDLVRNMCSSGKGKASNHGIVVDRCFAQAMEQVIMSCLILKAGDDPMITTPPFPQERWRLGSDTERGTWLAQCRQARGALCKGRNFHFPSRLDFALAYGPEHVDMNASWGLYLETQLETGSRCSESIPGLNQ